MPRPCQCDRVSFPLRREAAPGDCYLCWLFYHPRGERYRELWQEWPDKPGPTPCPYLGAPTGETLPCPCPHAPRVELYHCRARKVCTLARPVLSIPCCVGCEERPCSTP